MESESSSLFIPPLRYPVDLENPNSFTVEGFINLLKEDSVLADKLLFPNLKGLFPFQRAIHRILDHHSFIWFQAGRGLGKSYEVGRWCAGKGFVYPAKFVYAGPTYRQSKHPWRNVKECILSNSDTHYPLDLKYELSNPPTEGTEAAKIVCENGTTHIALPMGDGTSLRGQRAHVLVLDEFYLFEREMYARHILPFLQGDRDPGGLSKLIIMTSAEFQDSFAYTVLRDFFIGNIREEDALVAKDPNYSRKYAAVDVRIRDAESEGYSVNWDVINAQLTGASKDEKAQALENKWQGNAGFFLPSDLLERVQSEEVFIEHEAVKGYDYCLSVDVASQLNGDIFVIHVWKMLPKEKFALVNSFWAQGLTEDEMAWKIHQFDQKFNATWIVMDKGGGGYAVQNALAKSKLVFLDKSEKVVKYPILLHNEYRAIEGTPKLVLNRPADELVRSAFTQDRSRAGEDFKDEQHLLHFIYDGLRKKLSLDECPMLIPATYNSNVIVDGIPESETYEHIKESVLQLKLLRMKTKDSEDGLKEVVKSTYSHIPLYEWRYGVHDGASAIAYGYLAYKIYNRNGDIAEREHNIQAVPVVHTGMEKYKGMVEIYEHEIYRIGR